MKSLPAFVVAACLACIAPFAHATVSLQFSEPFSSGIASGFANAAGTPTNGMAWGIVVDTGNNGFSSSGGAYNSYATPTVAGFLSVGGVLTDDYFIPSGAVTSDFSAQLEGDFTTHGGAGTIDTISAIPVTPTSGAVVSSGEAFGLIWLATSTANTGDKYGFLTHSGGPASFVLPTDGSFTGFGSDFTGTDAAKPASFTFTAGTVPEPGMASLSLLGFAGLFLRRRR